MLRKIMLFMMAMALASPTLAAGGDTTRTVLVGCLPDNAGTSYLDANGVLTGYEIEVIREISRRLPDMKFEFRTMDFATLFVSLGTKKVDLILSNIKYSPERAKQYLYTKEDYFKTPYKLVVKDTDNTTTSFKDLEGKKIALVGTGIQAKVLEDYIKKHGYAIEIIPSKANSEMVTLLTTGRVDALFLPEHQVNVFNRYRGAGLKAVGRGLIPAGVEPDAFGAYFLVQKDDTALRDRLDAALQDMKKDGSLKKLSLEWFGQDFTVPFEIEQ